MKFHSLRLIISIIFAFTFFHAGLAATKAMSGNIPEGLLQPFGDKSVAEIAALAAERRAVLLGEASHGTSEFYTVRSDLSRELIENHGFSFIVVEGDWDAAWRVNQYVKQLDGAPASARDAIAGFTRWPEWMWNNEEVLELVTWLRDWNDALPDDSPKVGFYGMDVYGFEESNSYLRSRSEDFPSEVRNAVRIATQCMGRFSGNREGYLRHVQQTREDCGADIRDMVRAFEGEPRPDGFEADEWFNLQQHARVIRQAELHTRGMLQQGPFSWNERASHFKHTMANLLDFYDENSSGIAWAHNTHIGDARATDMANAGMHNIGQLMRQAYGAGQVFAIGFGTYSGTVKAGTAWESPMQRMDIPAARPGSLEALLYEASDGPVWINLGLREAEQAFSEVVPHRAIGVVYNPANDRQQNYVNTDLNARYNAFIFLPETRALTPLGSR